MEAHLNVLKLCKSEEKRGRFTWVYARYLFFLASVIGAKPPTDFAHGLALALLSDYEDARFLVSLFPQGPPTTWKEAAAVFLVQGNEPRCLCWAAVSGAAGQRELLRRSALGGYAWGICCYHKFGKEQDCLTRESTWAMGEPNAMLNLGSRMWIGRKADVDERRAVELVREAASLGEMYSFLSLADMAPLYGSVQYYELVHQAAIGPDSHRAVGRMISSAVEELEWLQKGGSGRFVFEIGAVWKVRKGFLRDRFGSASDTAGEVAISLHTKWCGEAKSGILGSLWLSRSLGVLRDIRLLIANLVWQERAAWSERGANPAIVADRDACFLVYHNNTKERVLEEREINEDTESESDN